MLRSKIIALAGLALVLSAVASKAQAEDYEIKLSRPSVVGQKSKGMMTITSESSMVVTVNGKEQTREEKKEIIHFEAIGEVLKVDEKGRPLSASITFDKLVKTENGVETELLKKGDVVLASVENGKAAYKLKGGELSDGAREVLTENVHLYTGQPDDDEIFGTPQRQKPGDSWAINADGVAKMIAAKGIKTDRKDITGKSTLVGPVTVGNVPALEIVMEFDIKELTPLVPLGLRVEKSSVSAKMSSVFPLDPALDALSAKATIALTMVMSGTPAPDQAEVRVATTQKQTMEASQTPIK